MAVEKRTGFRVSVNTLPEPLKRNVSVQITHGNQTSEATILDLSLSGVLITDLNLIVKVGDSVTVVLEAADVSATLSGSVVRTIEEDAVGIYFPESFSDGEFDPPARLTRIHRALEQAWLRSRKKPG